MMKKQLYRVKQLADQRVGRAEKTDLLTEDLQHVEKTVDKIKVACTTTSKKLQMCMQSSGPDVERRRKKLNQLQLGQGMLECATILGDASVLGAVMLQVGESQSALAGELATFETEVDETISAPLQKIVDTDIPNIMMTKKKLSKARLDMDASKSRWLNAVKLVGTSKGNAMEAQAKSDLVKFEYEDNSALFHSLQDTLATEMFSLVAGESMYAEWMVKLLEAQMKYHEAALEVLRKSIPIVKEQLDASMFRPVFGCPLDVHLNVTDREIAYVIEECVLYLLENAMDVEGLFRLAGSASKIKKLKATFDAGLVDMEEYVNEIHTVTGILKLYLRELPEPILTFDLYDEWIEATKIKDRDQRLQELWTVMNKLPENNKVNFRYLVCFLSKLSEQSEVNKMSPSNIAIVIGPNLLWRDEDNSMSIAHTGNISNVLETFIEHCQWFFPEGCEFTRHQISAERLDAMTNRFVPKESESDAPEIPSIVGGGSLFSEVSKKLGWKEDKPEPATPTQTTAGVGQSANTFYNPLASQYDPDLENNDNSEVFLPKKPPAVAKKPVSPTEEEVSQPYASHHKSSVSLERSSSSGSTNDLVPPTHKRQNSIGAPRRPAPPVPKIPPGGPPKTKPPEPPSANGVAGSPTLMRPPDIPTAPKPKISMLELSNKIKKHDDEGDEKPD